MRPVDVKKFKYGSNLASKRRRNFNIRAIVIIVLAIVVLAGIGYALFYMPWLKVNTINLEGLTSQHQTEIQQAIEQNLDGKVLGIPVGRDILFVRPGSLAADLTSQFSFLDNISIQKKYFHTLKVVATERQAEGVWCFASTSSTNGPDCRYFDHNGITFGQAIQSSGVLLLNVDDMRIQSASTSLATVDPRFFKAIQVVIPVLTGQDIKVKKITIPADTYTEFDVLVGYSSDASISGNYSVKFSLDSDLQNQLDIFRIFRTQKMASGTLRPQYVDLRFDGRVYFK